MCWAKLDRDILSLEKKPCDHAQAGAGARSDNNVRIVHVQARGAGAKLERDMLSSAWKKNQVIVLKPEEQVPSLIRM